jgi:cytochrome c553
MKEGSNGLIGLLIAGMALSAQQAYAQAPGNRTVKQLVESRCSLCHGMEGDSSSALFPRLAGQHPEYLGKQLEDFRTGRRKGTMNEMAVDLSSAEIKGLSEYFANQKIGAKLVRDADLSAVGRYIYHKGNPFSGVAACEGCHGTKGLGTAQLPRLAGQRSAYTEQQLKQFNTRERNNDNAIMHSIAAKLTELEVKAVATYISGLE